MTVLKSYMEGRYKDDATHDWDYAKIFDISEYQYLKMSHSFSTLTTGKYCITKNNCATYALNLLRSVGVRHNFQPKKWNFGRIYSAGNYLHIGGYKQKIPGVLGSTAVYAVRSYTSSFYGYNPAQLGMDIATSNSTYYYKREGNIYKISGTQWQKLSIPISFIPVHGGHYYAA